MNFLDTLKGLLRRWYVVVPGFLLAAGLAFGSWNMVHPEYERTGTRLLLPGKGTVPAGTTNPYLFLGGLTQAADIVVQVMKSEEQLGQVAAQYPGTDIVIQRDPTVSGPVVQIIVTSKDDDSTAAALDALMTRTTAVLDELQTEQKVKQDDRMSITTLTQDTSSTLKQKSRVVLTGGTFIAVSVLTLIAASLVDGLARPRRRRNPGAPGAEGPGQPTQGEADQAADPERTAGGSADPMGDRATEVARDLPPESGRRRGRRRQRGKDRGGDDESIEDDRPDGDTEPVTVGAAAARGAERLGDANR